MAIRPTVGNEDIKTFRDLGCPNVVVSGVLKSGLDVFRHPRRAKDGVFPSKFGKFELCFGVLKK